MGYVQQVTVQVGDRVREASCWSRWTRATWRPSAPRRGRRAPKSRARSRKLDNGIAAAKANLDLAQSTFKRMEELAAQEIDLQPGVRRSLGAAESGAGRLRDGARAGARRLDAKIAQVGAGSAAPRKSCATTRRSPRPFAGVVTARSGGTGQPGSARRAAAHHRAGRRLPAGGGGGGIASWPSVQAGPAGRGHAGSAGPQLNGARLRDRARGGRGLAHLHREDRPAGASRSCAPACSAAPSSRWAHSKVLAGPAGRRGGARPTAVGVRGGRRRGAHPPGHHRRAQRRRGGSALRAERGREGGRAGAGRACSDGAQVEVRQ